MAGPNAASMTGDDTTSGRQAWAIKVVVEATETDAQEATEAIERALCPDPGHEGPCPVP